MHIVRTCTDVRSISIENSLAPLALPTHTAYGHTFIHTFGCIENPTAVAVNTCTPDDEPHPCNGGNGVYMSRLSRQQYDQAAFCGGWMSLLTACTHDPTSSTYSLLGSKAFRIAVLSSPPPLGRLLFLGVPDIAAPAPVTRRATSADRRSLA